MHHLLAIEVLNFSWICQSKQQLQRLLWIHPNTFQFPVFVDDVIHNFKGINIAFHEKMSELQSVIWHMPIVGSQCYCYLPPDTGERATSLVPDRQAATWFTYSRGTKGWVYFGVGYIPRRFTCAQTCPSSKALDSDPTRPRPRNHQFNVL